MRDIPPFSLFQPKEGGIARFDQAGGIFFTVIAVVQHVAVGGHVGAPPQVLQVIQVNYGLHAELLSNSFTRQRIGVTGV